MNSLVRLRTREKLESQGREKKRRPKSIAAMPKSSLDTKVQLEEEYEILHVIQEGWRGRLLLVEHRRTRHEVVLKAVHKDSTGRLDFFREFHYNYYLSPHKNILNAYDVAFEAGDYYVFAQELATFGDLTTNLTDVGLGEAATKKIAVQLASALDFMHSKDLVHRDINMDNILVFNSDFSWVKLCDFGSTRKQGTLLKKRTVWLPYAPPEIVDAVQNEGFHADTSHDVWQLGILVYVLLTGQLPWQKADLTDPHYAEYINWRKRRTLRTPKRFTNFTSRLLRMLKRLLEPKPEKRSSVREVFKYAEDKWLVRPVRRDATDVDGQSVCYSTYSMHSCPKEKDRVLRTLKAHGIETTVDRIAKRQRINEWLERTLSNRNLGADEDDTPRDEDGGRIDVGRRVGVEVREVRVEGGVEGEVGVAPVPPARRSGSGPRVAYEDVAALTIAMAKAKAAQQATHKHDTTNKQPELAHKHGTATKQDPTQKHETPLRNGYVDAKHEHHTTSQTTTAPQVPQVVSHAVRGPPPPPPIIPTSPIPSRHAQTPTRLLPDQDVAIKSVAKHTVAREHQRFARPSPGMQRRQASYKMRREGVSRERTAAFDLQRSKTDSYIVTGGTGGGNRRHSQGSESSDASMTSMVPGALR